ncbi:MAG: glycosyltransferase [Patescibacteria group bacterium]|jgi:glycosyltransferase involved in cell wall biosynthesis
MKVALVHEHLAQDGGAERVVQVLQEIFPEAPLYTLVYDKNDANPAFRGKDIRTSFLQKMPFAVRHYQWYLTMMPTAVESYELEKYDVVISSSSAFAKGIITRPETLHICYLHSPTRYLWSDTHRYVQELSYNAAIKKVLPHILNHIRIWDRVAADRVDVFIANSKMVQRRIEKYYRRTSDVIYPPVDTSRFSLADSVGNYYLTGGRLVAYKRFDIAVQAFNKLGIPLKIFGTGPELRRLRAMAKKNIEFVGRVSDEDLPKLYQKAIAFLNPQEEDFGITVIEAMAAGRPIIAYNAGGAMETVIPNVSGVFFEDQMWESLADAVIRFKPEEYDPQQIQRHAQTFSTETFKKNILEYITQQHNLFKK